MTDRKQKFQMTRRRALLLGAAGSLGAMGIGSALDQDGETGNLHGGRMALSQAFNVSKDLWIGPDSAKDDVNHKSGRVYMATDTQVDYYSDGTNWNKLGVGSESEPAGASHFQSLSTESLGVTKNVILAYGPAGELVESVDPDDFGDFGAAVNDAVSKLPQHGDSNVRQGRVVLPALDSQNYSTTIKAYEHLTIEGQGPRATHLNYTGTDEAIKDSDTRASATNSFELRNLRIDADDGTFLDLYQPNDLRLENVQSIGADNSGSKGIRIVPDNANSGSNTFYDVEIRGYDPCFEVADPNTNGNSLANSTFINCTMKTAVAGGDVYTGIFSLCQWIGGDSQDGDVVFNFDDGSELIWIGYHIEQVNTGIDATDLGGHGYFIGGNSNSVTDPNDHITLIDDSGANNIIKQILDFESVVNFRQDANFRDSNSDGTSRKVTFRSSGNKDGSIEVSNGNFDFYNETDRNRFLRMVLDGAQIIFSGNVDTTRFVNQIRIDATDLTAGGAPAPSAEGVYKTHDGTGTPGAGLYRSDPGNNQWVKVEDNSTTIAY